MTMPLSLWTRLYADANKMFSPTSSGLPLQQRTGRLGHVIQNRKEATVARHRTQTHLQQNQNTGTRNRHHVLHGQHAVASGAHAHFHGGHSHEALLAQHASLRRGLHHNHTGHGHKLRYHVPSHKHFAAKRTKRPIKQRGTNGSRKGKTLGGMALDLSALMIDKDLLKERRSGAISTNIQSSIFILQL